MWSAFSNLDRSCPLYTVFVEAQGDGRFWQSRNWYVRKSWVSYECICSPFVLFIMMMSHVCSVCLCVCVSGLYSPLTVIVMPPEADGDTLYRLLFCFLDPFTCVADLSVRRGLCSSCNVLVYTLEIVADNISTKRKLLRFCNFIPTSRRWISLLRSAFKRDWIFLSLSSTTFFVI